MKPRLARLLLSLPLLLFAAVFCDVEHLNYKDVNNQVLFNVQMLFVALATMFTVAVKVQNRNGHGLSIMESSSVGDNHRPARLRGPFELVAEHVCGCTFNSECGLGGSAIDNDVGPFPFYYAEVCY
jgi:hypothetical protein